MWRHTPPALVLFLFIFGTYVPLSVCGAPEPTVAGLPGIPDDIKSAYDDRSYEEVISFSKAFLQEHPDSPARHEVKYLAGEACWELKRYPQVEEFLISIVNDATGSPRWPPAALLLSQSLEKQRKYFESALWLSRLLSRDLGKRARDDAEDLLEELGEKRLSAEELNYLVYRYQECRLHCWMVERAAEAEKESKRWEELWDLLGLAVRNCGDGKRQKTWDKLAAEAAPHAPVGRCGDPYLVGLACPLKGPYSEFGESMTRGAGLVLEEYNSRARYALSLVVRDTEGDPVRAVVAARELALDDGVVCLVGGLLSSTTIAAAGVASALGIPLVSPSATREEISNAGPMIYQTTLPRVMQARALAGAARGRLGAAKAGVLFPETADGRLVGDAFKKAFEDAGGTVVISSGYQEGETNFSGLLSAASSKSPDCLMLPGGGRDLIPLIPQLSYYGLNIPVLAMESIASDGVAELARRHLDRVLYSPDTYALKDNVRARFEETFMETYDESPDEFAIKGYIALRLVVRAIEAGGRSRSGVGKRLDELVDQRPELRAGRFLAVTGMADVEVPVLELTSEE